MSDLVQASELLPIQQLLDSLTEYKPLDIQVGFAHEVLYGLGITLSKSAPKRKKGEALVEYLKRVDPEEQTKIEALGIGRGRQLEEALRTATRLILYRQYTSGDWIHYAKTLDVSGWSPYVTHLLDDCMRLSDSEGRRWAVAIEVIAALYSPQVRAQVGIESSDVLTIDQDTGEIVGDDDGLPATPEDAILDTFGRYAREAGVKLRDLLRDLKKLPYIEWGDLLGYQREGLLDNVDLAAREGWDAQDIQERRKLYKVVTEIRRILDLATSPMLSDKEVNREATGGKSTMPQWVLPNDAPPAWVSYLTQQYPEAVSGTQSPPIGRRAVQVRLTEWPKCRSCNTVMAVGYRGLLCPDCGGRSASKKTATSWEMRVSGDNGHYPDAWKECGRPSFVDRGMPEVMDIKGLGVSLWEVWVDLDELD